MVLARVLWCVLAVGALCGTTPAVAQDSEQASDLEGIDERIEEAEQGPIEMEDIDPEDATVLGLVQEIEFIGGLDVKRSVLRRQLAFRIGDLLTQEKIIRSEFLLRRLRLFQPGEGVKITFAAVADDDLPPGAQPLLKVTVNLRIARQYAGLPIIRSSTPYLIGATASHRNLLGDATEISVTGYSQRSTDYYQLTVTEPQLFGGHHMGSLSLHSSATPYSIRLTDVDVVRENYNIDEVGVTFVHRTDTPDVHYWWGVEWAESDVQVTRGTLTDDLMASGTNVADGTWMRLLGGVRDQELSGRPWTTEGWAWSLRTVQSLEALGSEATYGTYRVDASGYYPLGDDGMTLAIGLQAATSSGTPPHYEAPRAGGRIRGYTGVSYASRSALTGHAEVRFPLYEDIVQGVVFCDAGRGYDTTLPGVHDLETGYGAGIRVRTGRWFPIDYVISGDVGFSGDDYEIRLGLGQWF